LLNNKNIGHSNVNKIVFGEEAHMHLHIWSEDVRKKGVGAELVKLTIPYFFENLKLKKLYCEPYALNQAPNKTLQKVGFEFVKKYRTTPGWLNFEQEVNLWVIYPDKFKKQDFK
ncbi:MAG TPA: GNAT family protein, partial [Nitrosopumilaceae archaeon]|nr:GNAT family protein [Nitrosopumilaceae archaeon]